MEISQTNLADKTVQNLPHTHTHTHTSKTKLGEPEYDQWLCQHHRPGWDLHFQFINAAYFWGVLATASQGTPVSFVGTASEPLVISVTFSQKIKQNPLLVLFSDEMTKRQTA